MSDDEVLARRVAGVLEIPLHRWLGIEPADPGDPTAGVVLPVGPRAINNVGLLHGGIVGALLDVAAYLRLLPGLGPDEQAVTHDATTSLLRSVHEGARVHLRGTLIRRGRSLAFLRAEASVDGEIVAVGQLTKTVLGPH